MNANLDMHPSVVQQPHVAVLKFVARYDRTLILCAVVRVKVAILKSSPLESVGRLPFFSGSWLS